jgi:hypothetical protein
MGTRRRRLVRPQRRVAGRQSREGRRSRTRELELADPRHQAPERLAQAGRTSHHLARCPAICGRVLGEVARRDGAPTRCRATRAWEPGPGGIKKRTPEENGPMMPLVRIRRSLKTVFARIATADASGVLFDLRQRCIKRSMWPLLNAGHRFQRLSVRVDDEVGCGRFPDEAHRAAKQVREVPCLAVVRRGHDHVQAYLPSAAIPLSSRVFTPPRECAARRSYQP